MGRRGRPPYPDVLTPREQDVLALVRENLTNEQIAARLGISFETAKHHVSEILSKLGVATREEAAVWPAERGWSPGRIALGVAGVGVMAAAVAGLALLAWGLSRASDVSDTSQSPAGRVAFFSDRDGDYDVWVVDDDGTGLRKLVDLGIGPQVSNLEWSDDGETLTFYEQVGTETVWEYTADLAGDWNRVESELPKPPTFGGGAISPGTGPVMSPDGTRVAYYVGLTSTATGAYGNPEAMGAWVADADASDARRLLDGQTYSRPTDWSPDGSRIAMDCHEYWWAGEPIIGVPPPPPGQEPKPVGVCLIDADGSDMVRLTDGWGATWFRDGERMIFERSSLYVMRSDGTDVHPLTGCSCGERGYAWYQP